MKSKKGGPSSNSIKPTNAQVQMQAAQNSQQANNNKNNVPLFTNADQQMAANMGMQIPVQQMQMQMPVQQMQMPQSNNLFSNINSTPMTNVQQAQVRNVSGGFYGSRQQVQAIHPPQEQIHGFFNDDQPLVEKAK